VACEIVHQFLLFLPDIHECTSEYCRRLRAWQLPFSCAKPNMLALQSIAVLPGVAIGQVLIPDQDGFGVTRFQIHSSDRYLETSMRPAIQAGLWLRLDFAVEFLDWNSVICLLNRQISNLRSEISNFKFHILNLEFPALGISCRGASL
jgi:hypothetical protein